MAGVDGVFRRCCEETLRVLRERSSVIMTILEVFKHDPLQNWCVRALEALDSATLYSRAHTFYWDRAVSAEMAKRIQGSTDVDAEALDELPDDADRALAIIRGKLDNRLSVEYTVNKLIQEATDPTHLARIFSGQLRAPASPGLSPTDCFFPHGNRLAALLLIPRTFCTTASPVYIL